MHTTDVDQQWRLTGRTSQHLTRFQPNAAKGACLLSLLVHQQVRLRSLQPLSIDKESKSSYVTITFPRHVAAAIALRLCAQTTPGPLSPAQALAHSTDSSFVAGESPLETLRVTQEQLDPCSRPAFQVQAIKRREVS